MNYKLDNTNINNNHQNIIEIINIHKYQCFNRSMQRFPSKFFVLCDVTSMNDTIRWLKINFKNTDSILLKGRKSIEAFSLAFQETDKSLKIKQETGADKLPKPVVVKWVDNSTDLYSTIQTCIRKFFISDEIIYQNHDVVSRDLLTF